MQSNNNENNNNNNNCESQSSSISLSPIPSIRTIEFPLTLSCTVEQLHIFFIYIYNSQQLPHIIHEIEKMLYLSNYFDCEYVFQNCRQNLLTYIQSSSYTATVNTIRQFNIQELFLIFTLSQQYKFDELIPIIINNIANIIVIYYRSRISVDHYERIINNTWRTEIEKQLQLLKNTLNGIYYYN